MLQQLTELLQKHTNVRMKDGITLIENTQTQALHFKEQGGACVQVLAEEGGLKTIPCADDKHELREFQQVRNSAERGGD